MDIPQHLNLQWNDHIPYMSKMLRKQWSEEQFCDLILVSEDGFVIKAHQAVLSMASDYFKKMLSCISQEQTPITVLHGIHFQELYSIIKFVYEGVTQVSNDCINEFLSAAADLEIKGLTNIKLNSSVQKLLYSVNDKNSSAKSPDDDSQRESVSCHATKSFGSRNDADPNSYDHQNDTQSDKLKHIELSENQIDQTRGMDLSLSRCHMTDSKMFTHDISNPHSVQERKMKSLDVNGISSKSPGPIIKRYCEYDSKIQRKVSDSIDYNNQNTSTKDNSRYSCTNQDATSIIEVSCSDGAITICPSSPNKQNECKKFKISRKLNIITKKRKSRKQLELDRKKWLAEERKSLFSNGILKYKKLKSLHKRRELSVLDGDSKKYKMSDHLKRINSQDEDEFIFKKSSYHKYRIEEKLPSTEVRSISPHKLYTLPKLSNKEKQTRTSLTLEERVRVIEAFLDGKSQRQIATMYNVGKTQVCGIIKCREKILSSYNESIQKGECLSLKRKRISEYATLNENLIRWHRHMTVNLGIKISAGMFRAKALELAPQLGFKDFKASNGWLATFKAKNNIKFCRTKTTTDNNSVSGDDEDSNNQDDDFTEENLAESDVEIFNNMPHNAQPNTLNNNIHNIEARTDVNHESAVHQPLPQSMTDSVVPPVPTKNSQMPNMITAPNIAAAYNLTREHSRTEMTHREHNIGEIHSSSVLNSSVPLSHPVLQKPDSMLAYKSEDAVSYGYDSHTRMNENNARGTEYNYSHYGFPGAYYGYHFLGQY